MYSSSITTGDFERFVARDVVSYIDAHYRTIPDRASRGLVGHSMGGYVLTAYGIAHGFEIYPGMHTSKVAVRFQDHVLPFFSKSLSFEQARR
jgi:alpha-beta hydrolase superfamily lysophospholipase